MLNSILLFILFIFYIIKCFLFSLKMQALKKQIMLKEKRKRNYKSFDIFYGQLNNLRKSTKYKINEHIYFDNKSFGKSNETKNKFEEVISPFENGYEFFSSVIKKNIRVLSNEYHIFDRIENIMDQEDSTFIYKKKVIKYFEGFINFLEINSKTVKSKFNKITNDYKKIIFTIKEINIVDIYNFVNYKFNYYKEDTKNRILSIMRRFSRILNNDPNLDYQESLCFHKSKNNSYILTEEELNSIVNYLKNKDELECLILFYFLYFSGLNFYYLARCRIKDFQKDFDFLKLTKNKTRKIHIPLVIKRNIKQLLSNKNDDSKFLFINKYNEKVNIDSRATYLKETFANSIKQFKGFSGQKKSILIKYFSHIRKYKILTEKFFQLFDYDFKIIDDSSIPNLFSESRDISLFSFKSPEKNLKNKKPKNVNDKMIKHNTSRNLNIRESGSHKSFLYDIKDDESFLEDKPCNRFFRNRMKINFNKNY